MSKVFSAYMRVNIRTYVTPTNFPAWTDELAKLRLTSLVVCESNQAWTVSLKDNDPKSKFNDITLQVFEDSIHLFINLAAERQLPWQEKLLLRLLKLSKADPRRAAKIVPLLHDQGQFEKIVAKVRALVLAFELTYSK